MALNQEPSLQETPISRTNVNTGIATLAVALALLVFAFLQPHLSDDRKVLVNCFFALVAGSMGLVWTGIALRVSGQVGRKLHVGVRAFGGSAMFLIALFHPLFPPTRPPLPHEQRRLEISVPVNGSKVQSMIEVRGYSSFSEWNHFVLVSGVAGGDEIQEQAINLAANGEFSGLATLGSSAVGAGQTYIIRIVASRTMLKPGPFNPDGDQIFSNAVRIRRSSSAEGE